MNPTAYKLLDFLIRCHRRIKRFIDRAGARIEIAHAGIKWNNSWAFRKRPIIRISQQGGKITIGPQVMFNSDIRHNSWGIIQPVLLCVGPNASLDIGARVGLSGCTISARESIAIGHDTLIGTGAVIADNDAHGLQPGTRNAPKAIESAPVVIGNEVFVGARALVLKGVTIGHGCTVAAGSIVTHDIPPNSIAAGSPAKVIRQNIPQKLSST
mgnify:CR=1 FL=1